MFNLTRLRLLSELARRGTMTAVANACGLTSSAVSQQLATLEHEAGVPLFEKFGRRVRLTPAGVRLAIHAETVFHAVEAAALDLRKEGETPMGVLQVACFSSFAKQRLLPAAARLGRRFPEMTLVLHELEPVDSLEAVRDGRCDLAITFAYNLAPRQDGHGLVSKQLMEEPVLLALPPKWREAPDPLELSALAGEDWIVGARQSDDRRLAEHACAVAGFVPRMTHNISDYDLLLKMVAAGFGVGFVPLLGFEDHKAEHLIRRTPAGPPVTRRICAMMRPALATSLRIRTLLADLAENLELLPS